MESSTIYDVEMKEAMKKLFQDSSIPEDVKKLAEKKRQEIILGKLRIFKGPIKDNTGKIRIGDGEEPSFNEIYNKMDWVVEGVDVVLPKKE